MNELNDRDKRVLQLVVARASFREMAADLDCSVGEIQYIWAKLKGAGLGTDPEGRKARMRELTQKGKNVLRREGLLE